MSVKGTEKRKLQRVIDQQGNTQLIHPETSADMVVVDNTAISTEFSAKDVQSALKEIAGGATGAVHYNKEQTLTNEQKAQARKNIGAGTGDYNDLLNKPPIPTVNNGKLIINKDNTKLGEFTANQAGDTTINIDTSDKYDKTGGTISGNVTITGNLTVNGATTTIESTTLKVEDKLIEVAKDNTAQLASPAGIFVPKYDGTNNSALVVNGEGNAQVGDVVLDASGNINVSASDLQTLATRDDNLVDGKLVKFDNTTKKLVTDTTEYQTKTDTGLDTKDKTVVGAINEVKGTADKAATDIHNVETTIENIFIGVATVPKSTTATKFDTAKTISLTGDVTGTVSTDFSSNPSISTTLKNSGVTAGTYSAVQVNAKGIVTAGGKSIEFGASGQTTPSTDLMVGGLFFELVE